MKNIIIEIKGIGFPNKGAELMLVAIIEEFSRRGKQVQFAVEPNTNFIARARYGLLQIARLKKKGVNFVAMATLLPKKLRRIFGVVVESEIDFVLDASGFSYGDQWGVGFAKRRLGHSIRRLNRQGKKVVLLPQAFGPFENIALKREMVKILDNVDLVFPRDKASADYCRAISDNAEIHQCTDFTNTVTGTSWDGFDANQHQVCFIPNSKMLEMTKSGAAYIKLMQALLTLAKSSQFSPFILIHEGAKDIKLAEQIASGLDFSVDIVNPMDPQKIKWVIGQSYITISSRFHGLVSALSQNVPVIATGWSHKYQALLADYEVASLLYDVDTEQQQAKATLEKMLFDADYRATWVTKIESNSGRLKRSTHAMWDKVFELIK